MNLPDAPARKKNPLIRIGLAILLAAAAVSTSVYLAGKKGTTPDEKAQAVAVLVAKDVVTVITGNDTTGAVTARIKAVISQFNADSGCKFIGGTVVFGQSPEEATAAASKYLLKVRQSAGAAALGENLGLGYSVESTRGLMRGIAFAAVIVAVDCTPQTTSAPGGFGS